MIASVPVLWWLEPGPEYEYKELHLKKTRVRTHSLYKTDFNHLLGTELCSHGLWYEREHCPDYGGYHFHWHLRKIPVFQKARLSGGFLRCNNANKTLLAKILCLPPFLWWQHPPHPCNRYFVVRKVCVLHLSISKCIRGGWMSGPWSWHPRWFMTHSTVCSGIRCVAESVAQALQSVSNQRGS